MSKICRSRNPQDCAKCPSAFPGGVVPGVEAMRRPAGTAALASKAGPLADPGRASTSLLLTTTGRKSGERFVFPLSCGKAGDSYFVIASKAGAPRHPGWYRNLLANPDVEVQVETAKIKARARTAAGEERARLWEKPLEFCPPTPITSARPPSSCSTPSANCRCHAPIPSR
jgi:proline iminopeptidase